MRNICVLLMLSLCMTLVSCKKDKGAESIKITGVNVDALYTSAEINGTYVFYAMPSNMSLYYASNSNFNDARKIEVDIVNNNFSVYVSNLSPGKKYYYYLESRTSLSYFRSDVFTFTTLVAGDGYYAVETKFVTDITQTKASSGGRIIFLDDAVEDTIVIKSKGVCWSRQKNPTIDNDYIADSSESNEFICQIRGLMANTKYYVRAYASDGYDVVYGQELSFVTEPYANGVINGHEFVDLGLPSETKWATCNVGASSPEESGDYYAWGEVNKPADDNYSIENCSAYGVELGDISGNPSRDAARKYWGASWRMPTSEEFEELRSRCFWEWTTYNGVKGFKVKSINGNEIFLPASGYYYDMTYTNDGYHGYYWSSSVNSMFNDNTNAINLSFDQSNMFIDNNRRHRGHCIRAVSD